MKAIRKHRAPHRGREQAPCKVSTGTAIIVSVTAKDSFFESVVIKKRDNLVQDILNRKQYHRMKPLNVVTGMFEIEPGFVDAFRQLAGEHGLAVSEV